MLGWPIFRIPTIFAQIYLQLAIIARVFYIVLAMRCKSFPYVAASSAKVLVLGSMPGHRSLLAQEYYAHPQNQFWDIMGRLFGAGRMIEYKRRLEILTKNRVALWDVAFKCSRRGSMDANIRMETVVPNDLKGFFEGHPSIRKIIFNGRKAEELFNRLILKKMPDLEQRFKLERLPSTSPAFASLSKGEKFERWKRVL